MISEGDCVEIGGMKIGRGNRSTGRKPAPAPLCPPQIPHETEVNNIIVRDISFKTFLLRTERLIFLQDQINACFF
jgi:hypothetical protein